MAAYNDFSLEVQCSSWVFLIKTNEIFITINNHIYNQTVLYSENITLAFEPVIVV